MSEIYHWNDFITSYLIFLLQNLYLVMVYAQIGKRGGYEIGRMQIT